MIAVLGSINLDFVATSSRLPIVGETIAGSSFKVSPGGKGANQSLACKRAGSKVTMAGAVGDDGHGSTALSNLLDAGVDVSSVKSKPISTGVASIYVCDNGENTIIVVPGANAEVAWEDVDDLLEKMHSGDWLLSQLEIPGPIVKRALVEANRRGIKTLLNTAPFTAEALELCSIADVIVMNESEMFEAARALNVCDTDIRALHRKLHNGRDKLLVATKGREGSVAFDGKTMVSSSALSIVPVDTVGAGDTFVGYFAAGLDASLPIEQALRRATTAASLACLRSGAQSGIPLSEEVDRSIASREVGVSVTDVSV